MSAATNHVSCVDVGAVSNEQADDVEVAVLRRDMQRRAIDLGSGVATDASSQQHFRGGQVTVLRSEVQRRCSQLQNYYTIFLHFKLLL